MRKINTSLPFLNFFAVPVVFLAVFSFFFLATPYSATAAQKDDWRTNNIISDQLFVDSTNMSEVDIQNFLDAKIGSCDINGAGIATEYSTTLTRAQYAASKGWAGPPYTCLNKYYEVPKTEAGGSMPANNYATPNVIPAGAKSAAWIIKDAATRYNISPKVLLVKIATESAGPLTSDNWPLLSQYRYAMGSHCPDSGINNAANCDPAYAGFSIQMYSAAELMRSYLNNMDQPWWPYKRPGAGKIDPVTKQNSNWVGWNVPSANCGGTVIDIQTKATAALYTYTPYQPNSAALTNMYGKGDGCSAYGNRNFWRVYWDWFGPTRFVVKGGILEQYTAVGGQNKLGWPLMNEACGLKGNACFQDFQYGSIYWTPEQNKAYTILGGMKYKWDSLGKEWSSLGYPISNEVYTARGVVQTFQNGKILYIGSTFYAISDNMNISDYSYLGNPTGDTVCGIRDNGCYQTLTKGTLYWSKQSGSHPIFGGMYQRWSETGKEWGSLGYPTAAEQYNSKNTIQNFEKGTLVFSKNGNFITTPNLKYLENFIYLGNPKSDSYCGIKDEGCYQKFDNGYIYVSKNTGANAIIGGIYERWSTTGKEWGSLGYPTTSEFTDANGVVIQRFEKGEIHWTAKTGTNIYLK